MSRLRFVVWSAKYRMLAWLFQRLHVCNEHNNALQGFADCVPEALVRVPHEKLRNEILSLVGHVVGEAEVHLCYSAVRLAVSLRLKWRFADDKLIAQHPKRPAQTRTTYLTPRTIALPTGGKGGSEGCRVCLFGNPGEKGFQPVHGLQGTTAHGQYDTRLYDKPHKSITPRQSNGWLSNGWLPNIDGLVVCLALHHLGREIVQGPAHGMPLRRGCMHRPAEVGDLDGARGREEEVLWLDVSVDHILLVAVEQRCGVQYGKHACMQSASKLPHGMIKGGFHWVWGGCEAWVL